MQSSIIRLTLRKLYKHLPQFTGMNLLIVVGVTFFVTLYTIYLSYEKTATDYFIAQNYADIAFYGSFDESDIKALSNVSGIENVRGRYVRDFKDGEITLRAISITDAINTPYIYEGSMPEGPQECLLLNKHASTRNLRVGDTISLDGRTLKIKGLAATPEYVYLVRNERSLMSEAKAFGIVFVSEYFFEGPYNEIVAAGIPSGSEYEQESLARKLGNMIGAEDTILQKDQLNYSMYIADLDQIRTFAYIFPLIFTLLIIMIIFVMLKRTAAKERTQIGVYRALGLSGGKIAFIYASQAGFTALLGAVLGCVASMLLCDTIIGFFSIMFEVPDLSFEFYPLLWAGAILFSFFVCISSALLSIRSILKPLPAVLMRPRIPANGKQIFLEKIPFLWRTLSFNTRYALKSALRNKGRFFAVLMGMCGSCGLLVFALGFFNSAEYTQSTYFDEFTRYDVLLEFEPVPLSVRHPVMESLDDISRALAVPVNINGDEYHLIITDTGFNKLNFDEKDLRSGIVVPAYYADEWNKKAGELLSIDGIEAEISGLAEVSFGLALYTSYEYAEEVFSELPQVYNLIFARDDDITQLEALSTEYGFKYSTLEDEKAGFNSVMESLNTLIWFMLACAVILGLMVLYSVGLMNLSAREFEYMFMGVMGYPLKSIMLSHVKETVLQLLLAIPSGFLLGNILLGSVMSAFSGDSFVMSASIFPKSYLYSCIIITAMAGLMAVYSARHIGSLDIVEGLKARDE